MSLLGGAVPARGLLTSRPLLLRPPFASWLLSAAAAVLVAASALTARAAPGQIGLGRRLARLQAELPPPLRSLLAGVQRAHGDFEVRLRSGYHDAPHGLRLKVRQGTRLRVHGYTSRSGRPGLRLQLNQPIAVSHSGLPGPGSQLPTWCAWLLSSLLGPGELTVAPLDLELDDSGTMLLPHLDQVKLGGMGTRPLESFLRIPLLAPLPPIALAPALALGDELIDGIDGIFVLSGGDDPPRDERRNDDPPRDERRNDDPPRDWRLELQVGRSLADRSDAASFAIQTDGRFDGWSWQQVMLRGVLDQRGQRLTAHAHLQGTLTDPSGQRRTLQGQLGGRLTANERDRHISGFGAGLELTGAGGRRWRLSGGVRALLHGIGALAADNRLLRASAALGVPGAGRFHLATREPGKMAAELGSAIEHLRALLAPGYMPLAVQLLAALRRPGVAQGHLELPLRPGQHPLPLGSGGAALDVAEGGSILRIAPVPRDGDQPAPLAFTLALAPPAALSLPSLPPIELQRLTVGLEEGGLSMQLPAGSLALPLGSGALTLVAEEELRLHLARLPAAPGQPRQSFALSLSPPLLLKSRSRTDYRLDRLILRLDDGGFSLELPPGRLAVPGPVTTAVEIAPDTRIRVAPLAEARAATGLRLFAVSITPPLRVSLPAVPAIELAELTVGLDASDQLGSLQVEQAELRRLGSLLSRPALALLNRLIRLALPAVRRDDAASASPGATLDPGRLAEALARLVGGAGGSLLLAQPEPTTADIPRYQWMLKLRESAGAQWKLVTTGRLPTGLWWSIVGQPRIATDQDGGHQLELAAEAVWSSTPEGSSGPWLLNAHSHLAPARSWLYALELGARPPSGQLSLRSSRPLMLLSLLLAELARFAPLQPATP